MNNNKWKKRMATVFAFVFFFLAVLLFLGDFYVYTKQQVEKEVQIYMVDILNESAAILEKNMDFLTDKLETEARIFNMQGEMSEEEILKELVIFAGNPDISRATIVTKEGRVYSSEFGLEQIDPTLYVLALERRSTYINKPRLYEATGQYFIDISTPVWINDQRFGSLSISYDHTNLQRIFTVPFLDNNCSITLVAGDGTLIGRIGIQGAPEYLTNDMVTLSQEVGAMAIEAPVDVKKQIEGFQGDWYQLDYDQKTYLLAHMLTGVSDWHLYAGVTDGVLKTRTSGFQNMANALVGKVLILMILAILLFVAFYLKERRTLECLKDSYRLALKKSNDLFFEVDLENDSYVNHSEENEVLGGGIDRPAYSAFINENAQYSPVDDRHAFLAHFSLAGIKAALKTDDVLANFEYQVHSPEGVDYWFESTVIPMVESTESVTKIICIGNDITEQKLKTASLQRAAQLDGLAKLLNKVSVQEQIACYLRDESFIGTPVFFMMDIDYFKNINDHFGHVKGDEVIVQVAQVLTDIFGERGIIGRTGGDEFVTLLKDCIQIEEAQTCAKEVNERLQAVCLHEEADFQVSISIGIACFTRDGNDFETLYEHADMALYVAKNAGRGGYVFYEDIEK